MALNGVGVNLSQSGSALAITTLLRHPSWTTHRGRLGGGRDP